MMYDLEYKIEGMFTSFTPNTPAGVSAWNTIAQVDGSGKVFTAHLDSTLRQLRSAGYSVCKARKLTTLADILDSDDALLDALAFKAGSLTGFFNVFN